MFEGRLTVEPMVARSVFMLPGRRVVLVPAFRVAASDERVLVLLTRVTSIPLLLLSLSIMLDVDFCEDVCAVLPGASFILILVLLISDAGWPEVLLLASLLDIWYSLEELAVLLICVLRADLLDAPP